MKKRLRTILLPLLASIVLSCAVGDREQNHREQNRFIDLNGDKINDVVYEAWGKRTGPLSIEYGIVSKFSKSDGSYEEPITLVRWDDRPHKIEYLDFDKDRDIDFLVSGWGRRTSPVTMEYNTFLYENNGNGNFDQRRLINSQDRTTAP